MKNFIAENKQFIILMILWIIVGTVASTIMLAFVPFTLVLFKVKGMYKEMFLSFFLVLVLSDSRQNVLIWAQDLKFMLVLLMGFFYFFDRKNFPASNRIIILFLPFFISSIISLFYSESFFNGFQKTISYFLTIIIVTNYANKLMVEDAKDFLRSIVLVISLILLMGFVFYVISPNVAYMVDRYRGVLGNPNSLGLFSIVVFLLFNVVNDYHPNLFTRIEKNTFYALLFASIILSESRGAIIAVLLFVISKYFYKKSSFLGFVVLILFVFAHQYINVNIESIVKSLGFENYFRLETMKDGSGRLVAWQFAWKNIQNNFFMGRGFGYTEYLFFNNWKYLSILGHQGNAHNSYLTFWLDTGLVGIFLFLLGLVGNFIKATKNSKIAMPVLYTIIFSATVESWLTASLNPYTILVWLILAIFFSKKPVEDENMITDKETQGI